MSWIKGKKKVEFFGKYARIVYTAEATEGGVFDNFQKEIEIVNGQNVIDNCPFSQADINAIKTVDKIPIVDFTRISTSEFEFLPVESFGEVKEAIE